MLFLLGCNHGSAPVAFRERLAFGEDEVAGALGRLRERESVEEAVILSTCNRVEVLAWGETLKGVSGLKQFLCDERGVTVADLDRHVYHYSGLAAVRHLFEVAAGLDSMILGEPQIVGQVKQAYRTAKEARATGVLLDRMMQQCLRAAKRIRTETGISRHAVSVAFAAVALARRIFGDLQGRRALLIGSGKMMDLVAKHLTSSGIDDVTVTSRTYNRAVKLAAVYGGRAVHWADGLAQLHAVDIVVSCTAAPHTILGREQVLAARKARRGGPLFIIDIAVPRDVEPEVNELDNVYLYDIDGLQSVVEENRRERERAASLARNRIEREVEAFDHWRQSLEITPTIVALREKLLSTARQEVERFRGRLEPLSGEQRRTVDELTRALVQKILHRPLVHLRKSVDRGDVDSTTAICRELFGLEDEPDPPLEPRDEQASGPQRILKGGKRS